MPTEILFIAFVAMIAATVLNVIGIYERKKDEKIMHKAMEEYIHVTYNARKHFLKEMGAYPAPSGVPEKYYIDLPGGFRLVIYEGKIDGWYMA